jgi:hypothetical protein
MHSRSNRASMSASYKTRHELAEAVVDVRADGCGSCSSHSTGCPGYARLMALARTWVATGMASPPMDARSGRCPRSSTSAIGASTELTALSTTSFER